jgi:hypothetical protein
MKKSADKNITQISALAGCVSRPACVVGGGRDYLGVKPSGLKLTFEWSGLDVELGFETVQKTARHI